jgi:hypothetical protein
MKKIIAIGALGIFLFWLTNIVWIKPFNQFLLNYFAFILFICFNISHIVHLRRIIAHKYLDAVIIGLYSFSDDGMLLDDLSTNDYTSYNITVRTQLPKIDEQIITLSVQVSSKPKLGQKIGIILNEKDIAKSKVLLNLGIVQQIIMTFYYLVPTVYFGYCILK